MVVGVKVCELTDGFLWFVCGLYGGILTSPLILQQVWQTFYFIRRRKSQGYAMICRSFQILTARIHQLPVPTKAGCAVRKHHTNS